MAVRSLGNTTVWEQALGFYDAAQDNPLHAFVTLVAIVLVLTYLWRHFCGGEASPDDRLSIDELDEFADYFRALGAPDDRPHEQGSMVPSKGLVFSNSDEICEFENDFASGAFLSLHRATYDKVANDSGDYTYGEYFLGKKRIWEARVQMKFKVEPKQEELFFGIELEQYVPMNGATKTVMKMLIQAMKGALDTKQIYHSIGDDPSRTSGTLERPVFAMPLFAFDQFIVTPPGEKLDLRDPSIASMGCKRSKRVKQYRKELEGVKFQTGYTYTFCFWGISQWLDKINWEVNAFGSRMTFNKFCGRPPVHVVIYALKKGEDSSDKRHLQARKDYYFHLAFWSSLDPPKKEQVKELFKGIAFTNPVEYKGSSQQSLSHRVLARNGNRTEEDGRWFTCCTGR